MVSKELVAARRENRRLRRDLQRERAIIQSAILWEHNDEEHRVDCGCPSCVRLTNAVRDYKARALASRPQQRRRKQ
jgi:hypothetical protein